jgi:predicted restriction endonuclease
MISTASDPAPSVPMIRVRNQNEARRIIDHAYSFQCCVVCGMQIATCLQIAHLDHDAGNNTSDNLARLCPTHHWM